MTQLIGELTLKSPEFAALWARHPVKRCVSGVKRFRHPEVGDFNLSFEMLHLPEGDGQRMLTFTAEPESAAAAALVLLAATNHPSPRETEPGLLR